MGLNDVEELLIAKGANVNARDKVGGTPLYEAALWGHKDIVESFVAAGANVNARDKRGTTPLGIALSRGHKDIVGLLRKHGAK